MTSNEDRIMETAVRTKKVVVFAVDGSESSLESFQRGVALFAAEAAEGRVEFQALHVKPPEDEFRVDALYGFKDYWDKLEVLRQEQARELFDKFQGLAAAAGVKVKEVLLDGDARESIAKYCEETHPDMLVVGERGLGKVQKIFIGSVSTYCLHHVTCPVLVVKKPNEAKEKNGLFGFQKSRSEAAA